METTMQASQRVKSVYHIMRLTFGLVPIIAGLDKFTNLLTNWEKYLNPTIVEILPFAPHTFMMMVGVIEIGAGLLVLSKPHIGGYVVMAWLALIGLSLLASREYLDVAVRDFVMAIGAYSLAQIARTVVRPAYKQEAKQEMTFSTP
jgi:uncharacterized membrane protein YphA (DoxX/SURF4 family)